MPKSKNRKEQKRKSQARNIRIANEKNKNQKIQREFINKIIEQEKQKGLFENLPQINIPDSSPIELNGPTI
jgi:hypothetical protein